MIYAAILFLGASLGLSLLVIAWLLIWLFRPKEPVPSEHTDLFI